MTRQPLLPSVVSYERPPTKILLWLKSANAVTNWTWNRYLKCDLKDSKSITIAKYRKQKTFMSMTEIAVLTKRNQPIKWFRRQTSVLSFSWRTVSSEMGTWRPMTMRASSIASFTAEFAVVSFDTGIRNWTTFSVSPVSGQSKDSGIRYSRVECPSVSFSKDTSATCLTRGDWAALGNRDFFYSESKRLSGTLVRPFRWVNIFHRPNRMLKQMGRVNYSQ